MAKVALLIGVSEYEPGLNPLPAAVKDIEALRRVLQDPEMGGFDEVKTLANPESHAMQLEIETLFDGRTKDDLVLLFFSGHGIKDDAGRLYFASRITRKNTKGDLIRSTAVPTSFVHDIMNNSRAKRQAVILDCCFSGAFDPALQAKDDGSVDLQSQLGAEGRVVLTSSSSTQYSFEQQGSDLSIYTRYLVEGIETGAGDINSDGFVSMLELHEYAASKVQETAPKMTPKIIVLKDKGFEIVLAKARVTDPKLKYRKTASRYANAGTIRPAGRAVLNTLRQQLGLKFEEATEIEAEILRPYQERLANLQQYREPLVAEAEHEYPLVEFAREDLNTLQQMLGLRDEDVLPIQQEVEAQFSQQPKGYQKKTLKQEDEWKQQDQEKVGKDIQIKQSDHDSSLENYQEDPEKQEEPNKKRRIELKRDTVHSENVQQISKEIFISFAWGGDSEEFVNQLDQELQAKKVTIIRDKRDLGYKGLIKEFMERIGHGKCVIAVINDKYLKSPNCMFELVQVSKNGNFFDRIFPIVLPDAQIYNPVQRLNYIKHWETKKKELSEAIKEVGPEFLQGIREEIDQYTEIRNTIAELTSILKNMNTLTPDIHSQSDFEILLNAINSKLLEDIQKTSEHKQISSEDSLSTENIKTTSEKSIFACRTVAQTMTTVFVDLMRLLYVASSDVAHAANSARYPEFIDIAEQHFTDLKSHIERFSIDIDAQLHEVSLQLERRLSWILGRLKREPNLSNKSNEYFNKMQQIGQKLHSFCTTAMGEKYKYVIKQVDTSLSLSIGDSGLIIETASLDDIFRLRLYVQSQLLESNATVEGSKIFTIADDIDLDFGIYYFVLDQKLLDHRFPFSQNSNTPSG
jgi:uncharacterized caspase-like protein